MNFSAIYLYNYICRSKMNVIALEISSPPLAVPKVFDERDFPPSTLLSSP